MFVMNLLVTITSNRIPKHKLKQRVKLYLEYEHCTGAAFLSGHYHACVHVYAGKGPERFGQGILISLLFGLVNRQQGVLDNLPTKLSFSVVVEKASSGSNTNTIQ